MLQQCHFEPDGDGSRRPVAKSFASGSMLEKLVMLITTANAELERGRDYLHNEISGNGTQSVGLVPLHGRCCQLRSRVNADLILFGMTIPNQEHV